MTTPKTHTSMRAGAGDRSGRPVDWTRLVAAVLAFALMAPACGGDVISTDTSPRTDSASTAVPRRGSNTVGPAGPSGVFDDLIGSYGAGASDGGALIGYLEFETDGTATWRGFDARSEPWKAAVVEFVVTTDDGTLAIDGDGPWGCNGASGRYDWSLEGDKLQLRPVEEPCTARATALLADEPDFFYAWYRLDPVPVLDTSLVGEPVVVESPFGDIEWVQIETSRDLDEVTAIGGGFVAVAADGAERSVLVASTDGRSWVDLGVHWSPSTQLTAGPDGRLYAVGSPYHEDDPMAPTVSMSLDGGVSWKTSTLPAAPDDADHGQLGVLDASAGRAGLIISGFRRTDDNSRRSVLWIGDGESFEVVIMPFGDLGPEWSLPSVWALDTGFLASVWSDRDGPALWRSDDGLAWDRIDLEPDTFLYSVDGDTVVLHSDLLEHAPTSWDGGRTWEEEPALHPVGPWDHVVTFDRGTLAVETALFGPWVGVVWASTDGINWQRVFNPWPPILLWEPVVSGNVIVMVAARHLDGDVDVPALWVGRILE